MSTAIFHADFEAEMSAAYLGVDENIFYAKWHRDEPDKPFCEMLRYMTLLREQDEEEAAKRAEEDWAYEAAEAAKVAEAVKAVKTYKFYPCVTCHELVELGRCQKCYEANEAAYAASCAFKALPRCVFCYTYKDSAEELCKACDPSIKLRPPPNTEGLYKCYICQKEGPEPACDPCRQAMDTYGAVQCVFCEAYWLGAFDGEWSSPCAKCHPDYRAAYAARDAKIDEDMVWYEAQKKEWAAYAYELEEEEKEDVGYDSP